MNIPENLKYTRSHEWVEFLPDGAARVGLTDHAQDALGDLVFVNLPEAGDAVTAGEALGDVESVKAVSDIFCPVTGTVRAANEALLERIGDRRAVLWRCLARWAVAVGAVICLMFSMRAKRNMMGTAHNSPIVSTETV